MARKARRKSYQKLTNEAEVVARQGLSGTVGQQGWHCVQEENQNQS
jgi:hypothetical protein